MTAVHEHGDWRRAFDDVLPRRKRGDLEPLAVGNGTAEVGEFEDADGVNPSAAADAHVE